MQEIISEVSNILAGRIIISEWELERIILRALLRRLKLRAIGYKYEDVVEEIKNSFISEPLSLKNIHFSEKLEIQGEIFFHIHTHFPDEEEIERVYKEMIKSKRFIDSTFIFNRIMDNFFEGYSIKEGLLREYIGKYRYAVSYSLLEDVELDLETHKEIAKEYPGEYVIVVPTEREVQPFIRFFKKYSEIVKSLNIKIWVADAEKIYVNPFIGYPRDIKLWKKFKNPKSASMISSLWRGKVDKID